MVDPALIADLYYEVECTPDMDAVLREVQKTLPATELAGDGMLGHRDFEVTAEGETVLPMVTFIQPKPVEADHHDFSQTWSWPQAAQAVARARFRLSVVQTFGFAHPGLHRLRAMQAVVGALLRTTSPIATYWPDARKWTRPEHADGWEAFVNVRLFRLAETAGELFMDSLGLHALALPDVEYRFSEEDPNAVFVRLYNLAAHLLENGDVIADGDTVGDAADTARWRCRRTGSSIEPARAVLSLTAVG